MALMIYLDLDDFRKIPSPNNGIVVLQIAVLQHADLTRY